MIRQPSCSDASAADPDVGRAAAESGGISPVRKPKKLLDQVREAVRVRNYSIRTEHAYTDWVFRFVRAKRTMQLNIQYPTRNIQ